MGENERKKAYCTPLQEVQTKIPKSVTAYTGPYYVFSEVSKSLFIFMQPIFFVALEKEQESYSHLAVKAGLVSLSLEELVEDLLVFLVL